MRDVILALDQGTSSSRAIVYDREGAVRAISQKEFTQYFPQPGWVEHDAVEIWESERDVMLGAVVSAGDVHICGIGITNQRETTVVWDAATGDPVCNAIVWQDRRTGGFCDSLRDKGYEDMVRARTGLIIDAYFSGTKVRWILDNIPGARERAERGELRFGTIDSWLIWKLTGGKVHVTDASNASRTMLFDIHNQKWDEELLELLGIPVSMMPEVASSSEIYGYTDIFGYPVPIAGAAGDQQAALFGQMCLEPGSVKNTYGTGCFLLMNTGSKPVLSKNRLLTTVAWKIGGKVCYALEGSVFVAGSVVQWLRDGLGIIKSSAEVEALAASVPDSGGVCFVPALTGLGAPYWSSRARGNISGISRGTTAAHIARAALEGIAFQTMDVVRAMEIDAGVPLAELKVDGGASRNNLLMQFQADILGTEVVRPRQTETTAFGAACFAGLAVGFWKDIEELKARWHEERRFLPSATPAEVSAACSRWASAVTCALDD